MAPDSARFAVDSHRNKRHRRVLIQQMEGHSMLHDPWTTTRDALVLNASFTPGAASDEILVLVSYGADDAGHAERLERIGGCRAVRIMGVVPHHALTERLEQQGRLDIVWLAGSAPGDAHAADHIAAELERLGAAIVCEASGAALDAAFADFAHVPGTQFLTAPDAADCEMALAAACGSRTPMVGDGATSIALERIDRLQEEVARITAVLAAMAERELGHGARGPVSFSPMVRSSERGYRAEPELAGFGAAAPAAVRVDSAMVRRMLRQRRMREQFFPAEMFADPAWDMLLDLYAAQLEGHPVAVSSLCIAAAVPATTALRWIKTMTDSGMFERQADPRDGRRIFIALAPQAAAGMERYFTALATMRD
jgi:hypothetical protein